jgi:hypothetical protein
MGGQGQGPIAPQATNSLARGESGGPGGGRGRIAIQGPTLPQEGSESNHLTERLMPCRTIVLYFVASAT